MNEKQTQLFHFLLIGVIALLLISNSVTAFLFFQQKERQLLPVAMENAVVESLPSAEKPLDTPSDSETDTIKKKSLPVLEPDTATGEITVSWSELPVKQNAWYLFNRGERIGYNEIYENLENSQELASLGSDVTVSRYFDDMDIHFLGTIISGPYSGSQIFSVTMPLYEPFWSDDFFRVIKTPEKLIYLSQYSSLPVSLVNNLFARNDAITINDFEVPEKIKIPNSRFQLIKILSQGYTLITQRGELKKLFEYEKGKYVYRDKGNNCFIIKAPDGSVREYAIDIDFIDSTIDEFTGAVPIIPNFIWSGGEKNTSEFIFKSVGVCASRSCYYYGDYITDMSQLEKIGVTSKGDPIFALKDTNIKRDPVNEKNVFEEMYDLHYAGYDSQTGGEKKKFSFEEFLKRKPLVFWQDPFGDFMEFRNAEFIPMAECGKPVIYLYPEKEMDVRVEVAPNGGFTKTEPIYHKGWFVKATPESNIYNYADKKMYPYLFWEGRALNYEISKKGFVVRESEVASFLNKKLTLLGLEEKEKADFMEFWLPRFQGYPYYFVSFLPQEQFDALAPLSVFPHPQTVIRVFMDFRGLEKPIKVVEPEIQTPLRKGFTVVEWGGALHDS